jgi:hypothetical protein
VLGSGDVKITLTARAACERDGISLRFGNLTELTGSSLVPRLRLRPADNFTIGLYTGDIRLGNVARGSVQLRYK